MTFEPGELVARLQAALGTHYRIERELGRGGMGLVFLATDTTLDRPVAVKVMHPDLSIHGSITQRFLAEARMIARLRHPNIVTVHIAGEATGLFYYVMDHVPGESLRERLNRAGRIEVEEVIRIVSDISEALAAAGRAGLVHRDVKPENILLDSVNGRAMLADFGIARVAEVDVSSSRTGQGIAVGTPTYMSPEQAAGEPVDPRSDLYSLGVVAYEMLAGHPPFRGSNGAAIIAMQLSEKPPALDRARSDLSPSVVGAVMRALEKSPEDRWQTGAEFHRALLNEDPRQIRPPRRPRVSLAILAAGGALLLGIVAIAMALSRREGAPDGVNPRHTMLILPFSNLKNDQSVEWLREGSVNMLSLNMSQWNDLSVVDHERLHDLLSHEKLKIDDQIGLDMARRLARDAGVWTVVLGDYTMSGDSVHLSARVYDVASGQRVDVAQVDGVAVGDPRPLFDDLAAKLLDLSGAPGEARSHLAQLTTRSLEAYRSYLRGIDLLNQWELSLAEDEFRRAIGEDSTFGLAYYKFAMTRGWLIGPNDSAASRAIQLATRFADRLPQHERTVINAYRTFLDGDYLLAQGLYQSLLARDSTDADAWYGLGDALYHDTSQVNIARNRTRSLRAFNRALALDPAYSLAYEHILNMLTSAAEEHPFLALVSADSFLQAVSPEGRSLLDSGVTRVAVARARTEAIASGRRWVANQPETIRAHTDLMEALLASRQYPAALAELTRLRATVPGAATRPDLIFAEGRVRFTSGDIDGAARVFRHALDSMSAKDFVGAPPLSFVEVNTAAGVFSYLGDLKSAARAISLGDTVRRQARPSWTSGNFEYFERVALGDLYAGSGGSTSELTRLWDEAAEEARVAPPDSRAAIARSGTPAAVGLFIDTLDPRALKELGALTREPLPKEIRALMALKDGDKEAAKRILAERDTVKPKPGWSGDLTDRRPFAAQAYYLLGDYQRTLDVLDGFDKESLMTRGFDFRWSNLGRVRLLRAAALEKLGRNEAAAEQYRAVLAQWKGADPALNEYLRQAERGLARTTGAG